MVRIIGSIGILLLMFSCQEKKTQDTLINTKDTTESNAEVYSLEVYDFNEFEPLLSKDDGNTYVVNFWATWCAPCIKELPYFEKLNQDYADKNVEVLLVSLDFPKQYEKKLIPFIKDRKLKSKVVALDDPKMNDWIPKIDKDWSGAIPATIIYNGDKSKFYERSFNYEELENEIKQFINP